MAPATHARLTADVGVDLRASANDARARVAGVVVDDVRLAVYEDLSAIEREWRAFEQHADCTVFQTFDWLATWQRHIGARNGEQPAIVVGRDDAGDMLFVLPLSVRQAGLARKLTWLGNELCDYNAPLLAAEFSNRVDPAQFVRLWRNILQILQSRPLLRHDSIHLEKMPAVVGAQENPMRHLRVAATPSGAYLTHLSENWDEFYAAKRSSTTRRRDRTKRKRLAESGEVRLINPENAHEVMATIDTLMEQKAQAFNRMGIANLFARPGYPEFFRALATDPATSHLAHVSRLDVGTTAAAVNLGLTFRDHYYYLLASYDGGELSRFGPGAAHLHELMRQAIKRGFRVFDFTIGDEPYKRDWSDTELALFDHISVATWRGALVAMPLLAKRRLKRWIKQTPVLWSVFSRARAVIGWLLRR
jgi:CelD/BcsL family acetyltransferase involved in cellulose biosynthesis